MASIASMNSASLSEMLGREITDAVVLIAKNVVLGNDADACAMILGVTVEEIQEIQQSQDYKDVHLILASHHNHNALEVDFTYDDIEAAVLRKLAVRAERETDTDKLIRLGVYANRAVRRQAVNKERTLDPSRVSNQVSLKLTRRIIEKLQGGGETHREDQISITGPHVTPTFRDLEGALGQIRPARAIDRMPHGDSGDVSFDALIDQLNNK